MGNGAPSAVIWFDRVFVLGYIGGETDGVENLASICKMWEERYRKEKNSASWPFRVGTMKTCESRTAIFILLIFASFPVPFTLSIVLAANGSNEGGSSRTSAGYGNAASALPGSAHITITADGFDPAVLTITWGTEVTWYNDTETTHTLQSGEPCRTFLPVVLKNMGASGGLVAESLQGAPRTGRLSFESSESFSATLEPGETFAHTFTSVGDHPYFLATAPGFTGRVTVRSLRVAVYITTGAESDKLLALMRAVDSMGFEVYGIGRSDIDQDRLTTSNFDVFILPAGEGGSKDGYASPVDGLNTPNILNKIRAFVSSGGGFIGVEAGAYFASTNGGALDLCGADYNPWIAPVPGKYTFTIVDPSFGPGEQDIYMSAGGGHFDVASGATVIVQNYYDNPTAVHSTYGSGRVIVTSLELSLRGDSELDWTIWDNWDMGNNHTNSAGCWTLLGRMINWVATGDATAPSISASNPTGGNVAVLASHTDDGGAYPGLLPAIFRSIEYAGYTTLAIRFDDVRYTKLTTSTFDAVMFSGGYAYGYWLGLSGYESVVRYFVDAGGGYYGVCAGSFYASDWIEWEGSDYDYPLDLFSGVDRGPLDDIAVWPDYALTLVNVDDPVIGNLGDQYQMYYGGGYKTDLGSATTVATYEYGGAHDGYPDAIRFTYGSGHVLLVGTHPESRSGSNEDWVYWDNWVEGTDTPLNNPDNPWTFVDAVFDNWLIQ